MENVELRFEPYPWGFRLHEIKAAKAAFSLFEERCALAGLELPPGVSPFVCVEMQGGEFVVGGVLYFLQKRSHVVASHIFLDPELVSRDEVGLCRRIVSGLILKLANKRISIKAGPGSLPVLVEEWTQQPLVGNLISQLDVNGFLFVNSDGDLQYRRPKLSADFHKSRFASSKNSNANFLARRIRWDDQG